MYCPTCGTQSEPGASFCIRCGAKLPSVAPAEPAPSDAGAAPQPSTVWPPAPSDTWNQVAYPRAVSDPRAENPAWPATVPGIALSPFGAPLAGWWQRVGSLLVDVLVLVVPYGVAYVVVTALTSRTIDGVHETSVAATDALLVIFLVAQGTYFTVLNGTGRGQTVGNRAPGIAVRDARTGAPIGIGRGFVRWFVRLLLYVLVIPGVVNDLMPLWTARRQTIADKLANSVMIRV